MLLYLITVPDYRALPTDIQSNFKIIFLRITVFDGMIKYIFCNLNALFHSLKTMDDRPLKLPLYLWKENNAYNNPKYNTKYKIITLSTNSDNGERAMSKWELKYGYRVEESPVYIDLILTCSILYRPYIVWQKMLHINYVVNSLKYFAEFCL